MLSKLFFYRPVVVADEETPVETDSTETEEGAEAQQ